MEKLIHEIIDIEIQAKARTDGQKEEEALFLKNLAQELADMQEQILKHARERVEKIKRAEADKTQKKLEDLQMEYTRRKETLSKRFSQERESYLATLFSLVTEGEDHAKA